MRQLPSGRCPIINSVYGDATNFKETSPLNSYKVSGKQFTDGEIFREGTFKEDVVLAEEKLIKKQTNKKNLLKT